MKVRIVLITLAGMVLIGVAYVVAFSGEATEGESGVPWYLIARRRLVGKSMTAPKQCLAEVLGLQMSYTGAWGECEVKQNQISFRTSFPDYQVDLVASVRRNNQADVTAYKTKRQGTDYTKTAGGEVFKFACPEAFFCSGLIIDDKLYTFSWDIVSNQVKPAGAQPDWRPSHNVVAADIWTITKTMSPYASSPVPAR